MSVHSFNCPHCNNSNHMFVSVNNPNEFLCNYCDVRFDADGEIIFDHDSIDESMDGDHDSAMASAGFGTDEDYGFYSDDSHEY